MRGTQSPVASSAPSNANAERAPDGRTTRVYSEVRPTIAEFSNPSVTTTSSQLAQSNRRSPVFTIEADALNTDYILFGFGMGSERHVLYAGDTATYPDVAPADIWVRSNSGTQKAHGIGAGDPEAATHGQ